MPVKRRKKITILGRKFDKRKAVVVGALVALAGIVILVMAQASGNYTATAYSPRAGSYYSSYKDSAHPCGPYRDDGRTTYTAHTASGACPQAGRTIAASTAFRFGTTVCIGGGVGTRVVEDRGGAITGARIDIFYNNASEARNWGVRAVSLAIGACGSSSPPPSPSPQPSGGLTSIYACSHPTLSQGASGDCVRHLQDHLNHYGSGLTIDGSFGPLTKAAVQKFQFNYHVPNSGCGSSYNSCDGIVGPATWSKLHSG